MKTLLYFFFFLILSASCQTGENKKTNDDSAANNQDTQIAVPDTAKVTAIFWIDKSEFKNCPEYGYRTITAKVFVQKDGKVRLEAFCKRLTPREQTYIRHHLAKFRVSQKMLEGGYVKMGEQFVQLRCLSALLNKVKRRTP